MIKVMTVIGTRPEAVKMSPVVLELAKYSQRINSVVCATAQHREMLDQVLTFFGVEPSYDLDLMRPNQSLSQITARILTAFDKIVQQERPDWILVQGDTTTVMVASLVAYYHRIKVGHVEAGLRTGDKFQPFPEEINRRITDALADLYFAPTKQNQENLLREGIPVQSIVVTGNTVIDALMMTAERVRDRPLRAVREEVLDNKQMILVTAHRRENHGEPLASICRAVKEIALRFQDDVHIVYPVHYNPNVMETAHQLLGEIPNISLIEPVDYDELVGLLNRCYLVLTDSGGLQEESPSLDKPVLILREVTERPEVVTLGAAQLVGTDQQLIVSSVTELLEDVSSYQQMAVVQNPYGDGRASQRIVQALLDYEKDGCDTHCFH